jgi:hypothetical protein
MTETSGDRLLISGVSRHDLEFGFIGISGFKIESIDEPEVLGVVTFRDLREHLEQSGDTPGLETRLYKTLSRHIPEVLTEGGSINLDRLSEAINNEHLSMCTGPKTVSFAESLIASRRNQAEVE